MGGVDFCPSSRTFPDRRPALRTLERVAPGRRLVWPGSVTRPERVADTLGVVFHPIRRLQHQVDVGRRPP
jgi:hypothetical protein